MNRSYYRKALGVFLLLLLLVLAACADGNGETKPKEDSERKPDNATEESDESTGGGDLVLAVHSEASTLDPSGSNDVPSRSVQYNIFETLVKRDKDNNIVPSLAESWDSIDDKTFEFILRQGVEFHDGEKFNADVVKASLDRILDPEVASAKYSTFEMISNVKVVDEYTVQISTEYPFSPILSHLSHSGGAMISPKSIEDDYAAMKEGENPGTVISQNPIGTGYFKFEYWTPGTEIKLGRNEDYWGDIPLVDSVTFKVVPESGTRNADLERAFVHIVDPVQPNEVQEINDSDYATVIQTPSTALTHIGFNTKKTPFDDVRVRTAISMMVNKQEIIDGIYDGFAIPAEGPLAPKVVGHDPTAKGIEYNVEEAKKLMKEAGHEDGFKASIWTNDNPQRVDTAVLLQDALKELNIEINVEKMEFGAYLENLRLGEHDMHMLSWSTPLADGDNGLFSLFHSSVEGVTPNAMSYSTPEVDELINNGRIETDPAKRLDIYKKATELLIKDAPVVYLNHPEYLTGVSNSIEGFAVDTGNMYQLQYVKFVD